MSFDISNAAVVYHVRPKNPGAHLFEVTCRINKPDPAGQIFSMPAWIPGSYLIRDYARHVISLEAEVDGQAIPVQKIDKSSWQAGPVNGALLLSAEVYAHDPSVRGAFLDNERAFFNGVCVFFRIHGLADERCVVHLAPPDDIQESGWKVATGMARLTGTDDEFGAFTAMNYDELIDHPFLMGELSLARFDVGDVEHVIAIAGRHDADLGRLANDIRKICFCHADFFGSAVPMERYVFLVMLLNQGHGGLEHRNSAALLWDRDGLPKAGDARITSDYRDFLGLVSHEYFHLWNVKRIKPAAFVPYRLDQESYTRQMWVFEGITSYYDDLGLLRGELIPAETYLELLGRSLTAVYRSRGRRRQTLEESSFDTWIKFYKQDENAPNAIVSYYRKGAMVALALDLELRLRSSGQSSLDEVMRALWRKYGLDGSDGLPENGFEVLAQDVSGLDLSDFFRQGLRSAVDPPVGILLAQFGVRLHMRAMEAETDTGGKPGHREDRPQPWLGFRTRTVGDRVLIRHVLSDGPGIAAGLSANDELIAVQGYRVNAMNFGAALDRIDVGQTVEIDIFRHDVLKRVTVVAAAPPRNVCYLSIDADADAAAVQRREEWLGC